MNWLSKFKFSLPPMPTSPPVHSLEHTTLIQLSVTVLVAMLAHLMLGHPVIAGFGLLVWFLKTVSILRRGKNPPRLLVILLTIMSFVLILVFYGGWNGQKAGISFLVLLVSLKFLESQTLRDYYLVCLILFFLAASTFLFSASLLSILAVIAFTVTVLALMLKISNPTPTRFTSQTVTAGGIMLKALPLALLLFFFFPRISGSFGFIPSQDELSGDNQLQDSLVAGEFASGAFNNQPAFQVEFDGPVPQNSDLYWRVKVMDEEQTFGWLIDDPTPEEVLRARSRRADDNDAPINPSTLIGYQIVHEESSDNFLPYLDYASDPPLGIQLSNMAVYMPGGREGIFTYRGESDLQRQPPRSELSQRQQLLQFTSQPSLRAMALLAQWRRESNSDRQLVEKAYQYIANNEFAYSLLPPALGDNPMDEFLFETRTGYCEHYASAFTILMRWLGIPARVVVGYQGGSTNVVGGYLQIRYSDAHAWSEVWIEDQWQRIDATAAVSPERIDYGMEFFQSIWDAQGFGSSAGGPALANFLNPSGYQQTLRQIKDGWENMGYQWNKWVINYDFNAQRRLLANLGLQHRDSLYTLIALVGGGTLLLMLFYFWQLVPKAIRIGEAQSTYLHFVRSFRRHKLEKQPADTPYEFARRVSAKFPAQARQINAITEAYVQIRYGREADENVAAEAAGKKKLQRSSHSDDLVTEQRQQRLRQFKQMVRQFKPGIKT